MWSVVLGAACLVSSTWASGRLRRAKLVLQKEAQEKTACQWLGKQLERKRPCRSLQVWGEGGFLNHAEFNGVGNVGYLEILGRPHKGIVYASHEWSCHTIHDIVSVSEDGTSLALTYVYSDPKTNVVNYAYVESTSMGRIEGIQARGSVQPSDKCSTADAVPTSLPVWKGDPKPRNLGLKIGGPELSIYPNGKGQVVMDRHNLRETFDVTVFSVVDCTKCLASKNELGQSYDHHTGGWLELHILLDSKKNNLNDACFGIVYLFHEDPSRVEVHFGVCWPKLDTLPSKSFHSTWTRSGTGPLLGLGAISNVSTRLVLPLMA